MKEYYVIVDVFNTGGHYVKAKSKEEACKKAINEAYAEYGDMEFTVHSIDDEEIDT